MRSLFGIAGILVTLAIVGLLVKKQLAPVASGTSPQQQSEQTQSQVKQSIEAAMQKPRPMPDDK